MSLTRLDLYPYRMAAAPGASIPGGDRRGVLVRMMSQDGVEGWGEASPLPGFSTETAEDARVQLQRLGAHLPAMDADNPWVVLPDQALLPSVRFALELAAVNMGAAMRGFTPARVLAGLAGVDASSSGTHQGDGPVRTAALLACEPAEWVQRVSDTLAAGYRTIKLKVGRVDLATEIEAIRRLARFMAEGNGATRFRLDANRAWTILQAVRFWEACGGLPVEFVEEPLRDADQLPELAGLTDMPIALDETLPSVRPQEDRLEIPVAAIVVKPTLVGGFARAMEWATRFRGTPVVVSSSYETGIGLYGLHDLARALPGPATVTGLDTARALAGDVADPGFSTPGGVIFRPESYRVRIPDRP